MQGVAVIIAFLVSAVFHEVWYFFIFSVFYFLVFLKFCLLCFIKLLDYGNENFVCTCTVIE